MTERNGSTTVAEAWHDHNVIVVSFEDDRTAGKALTSLEDLDSHERVYVRDAVVVVRGEDGQVVEKERIESPPLPATAGGGLIGLVVGLLGGPLGVLVGGISGLIVGSLVDVSNIEDADSALVAVSSSVRLGHTALLAVVDEQSREVVDAAMSDLDGTVTRRAVADVEAEIAAAESAQRKAKREARQELARARHQHNKAAVQDKLEELRTRVHGGRQAEADEQRRPDR
jgi:uncharacterized membrane protein